MPRRGPVLTYRERKLARERAQANRRAINRDVDSVLDFLEKEAKRLAKKHERSAAFFKHQFYQVGRIVRQKRAINLLNAARQIEGFIQGRKGGVSVCFHLLTHLIMCTEVSGPEKERFIEIDDALKKLGGPEKAFQLPDDMKIFIKAKATAWREQKRTGLRANIHSVVQDARVTLERVSDEVWRIHDMLLTMLIYLCIADGTYRAYRHACIPVRCERKA